MMGLIYSGILRSMCDEALRQHEIAEDLREMGEELDRIEERLRSNPDYCCRTAKEAKARVLEPLALPASRESIPPGVVPLP